MPAKPAEHRKLRCFGTGQRAVVAHLHISREAPCIRCIAEWSRAGPQQVRGQLLHFLQLQMGVPWGCSCAAPPFHRDRCHKLRGVAPRRSAAAAGRKEKHNKKKKERDERR